MELFLRMGCTNEQNSAHQLSLPDSSHGQASSAAQQQHSVPPTGNAAFSLLGREARVREENQEFLILSLPRAAV